MKKTIYLAIIATVFAIIIRLTVFTEDCNLLIMAFTWLAIFAILTSISLLFKPKKTS